MQLNGHFLNYTENNNKKDAVCFCGWDPSQKGCSVFAEGEVCADASSRRQGRLPLRCLTKQTSFIWDYSSAVVQHCVQHHSLHDRFMLAGGELTRSVSSDCAL